MEVEMEMGNGKKQKQCCYCMDICVHVDMQRCDKMTPSCDEVVVCLYEAPHLS